MQVALPELVKMDGAVIPEELLFSVPGVPGAMYHKAIWYSKRKQERLHVLEDNGVYWFYLLSTQHKTWKKIDGLLVSRYNALLMGLKPKGITHLESMMDLAHAVHCRVLDPHGAAM